MEARAFFGKAATPAVHIRSADEHERAAIHSPTSRNLLATSLFVQDDR